MKLFYLLPLVVLLACTAKEQKSIVEGKSATPEIPRPLPMPSKVDSVPFKNCFLDLPYTHVVAYHYKTDERKGIVNIVGKSGKLAATVTKENVLHPAPLKRLTMALSDPETFGGPVSDCFSPEFGLVFYRNKKVIGHISICFACNNLHSTISLPEEQGTGFSKKGTAKLKEVYESLMLE